MDVELPLFLPGERTYGPFAFRLTLRQFVYAPEKEPGGSIIDSLKSDDAFFERMTRLREMTLTSEKLADVVKDVVVRTLDHAMDIQTVYPHVLTTVQPLRGSFQEYADEAFASLPQHLAHGGVDESVAWSRQINGYLRGAIDVSLSDAGELDDPANEESAYLLGIKRTLMDEDQRAATLAEAERFRFATSRIYNDVQQIAEEARGAANSALAAAGLSGSASLSDHFAAYASTERRAANTFRGLTIAVFGVAVSAAILLPHPDANDWAGIVYRLAILLGIAGLGTYFGGQAGQHRRMYNWAKALQVQLQSFPAFMEAVRDEATTASIYVAFARRVLGAPPEKAASTNADSPVNATQVVEIVAAFAKRSAN